MKKLQTLFKEHKKAAIIGTFLIAMFITFSAINACSVARHRAELAAPQEEEASSSSDQASSDSQSDDVASPSLTGEQEEIASAYDKDTKGFIEGLCGSVWTDDSGKKSLVFEKNGTYTVTANGNVESHTYAISRIDSGTDSNGYTNDVIVCITDTGTHVVYYMDIPKSNGMDIISLSSMTMFGKSETTFTRTEAVKSITIKGLNSTISDLVGNKTDDMTDAVSTWCAIHYPTAKTATWRSMASIDWTKGYVSLPFVLDTESPTEITVLYDMTNSAFSVKM